MNDQEYRKTFITLRAHAKFLEKESAGRYKGRAPKDPEVREFYRQTHFLKLAIKALPPSERRAYLAQVKANNAAALTGLDFSSQLRSYSRRQKNPNWTVPRALKNCLRAVDKNRASRLILIKGIYQKLSSQGIKPTTRNVYKELQKNPSKIKLVAFHTLRKDLAKLKAA